MKALTAAEMLEVDRLTTERHGVPGLDLMEAAGKAVAEALRKEAFSFRRGGFAVLCGKGNNGGDGFVVARYLKEVRLESTVYLFGRREEVRGDAAKNLEFEKAADLRDRLYKLKEKLFGVALG